MSLRDLLTADAGEGAVGTVGRSAGFLGTADWLRIKDYWLLKGLMFLK